MAPSGNWSDGKKWLMGILSALLLASLIPFVQGFLKRREPVTPPPVDVTLRKEGVMSFADSQKGSFIVQWRNLSLQYDGVHLDYEGEFSTSFAGCPSCIAQILVLVGDTAYQDCAFDGSANTGFAGRRGRFEVPRKVAAGRAIPVYLVAALDNNCGGAQAGHSHTGQEAVGTIWPTP